MQRVRCAVGLHKWKHDVAWGVVDTWETERALTLLKECAYCPVYRVCEKHNHQNILKRDDGATDAK
jgi:hypothetical protein